MLMCMPTLVVLARAVLMQVEIPFKSEREWKKQGTFLKERRVDVLIYYSRQPSARRRINFY